RAVAELAAVVDEDAAGAIVGRIERDLHLDATRRAVKLHALIVDELHGAGERRLAARRKAQQTRDDAVDPELGIAIDDGDRRLRLLAEQPARHRDGIAADVHQPAAAPLGDTAHVLRIALEVREVPGDDAQVADAALVYQIA